MPFSNQELHIITRLRVEVNKVSQTCYNPGCSNDASRSHILQENGLLNQLAIQSGKDKGKVYQMDIHDLHFKERYRFKQVSIASGQMLTFWGFCNTCDTKIFAEIEKQRPDFKNYRHQTLLSYRALLNELYKMQYNLKHYSKIFSSILPSRVKTFYESKYASFLFNSKVLLRYKQHLENELSNPSNYFTYSVVRIPFIETATSSIYTPVNIHIQANRNEIEGEPISSALFNLPKANVVFFHVIPNGSESIIIFGKKTSEPDCLVDYDLLFKKIPSLLEEEVQKLISSILIKYVETWCISVNFFKKLHAGGDEKKILSLKDTYIDLSKRLEHLNYNMFKL